MTADPHAKQGTDGNSDWGRKAPKLETPGQHAHRKWHQFLVCSRGKVSVVADHRANRQEYLLVRPNLGLHLRQMVWGILYKYSCEALLIVFASQYDVANDYSLDYDEFTALAGVGK